ncbi:small ribosomal subunit protein mS35-like isoform X2 [Ptychodera flava]|uniref:small ribosomal subunit protein mS35-like isoform X2 n=1 Tax=Ptychodera flava TaxID=63121 RepID=UPI00396A9BD2
MAAFSLAHAGLRNAKFGQIMSNSDPHFIPLCIQRLACYTTLSSSLPGVEVPDLSPQINVRKTRILAEMKRRAQRRQVIPPRHLKMKENQDWSAVWPTAVTFKPSAIPMPIRMGYPIKKGVQPSKLGNTELMKIPNFLHLTPPAVKEHCAVLKAFCTEWPKELDSDEKLERYFPLEVETTDYIFSGPSLRHPKARIVKFRIKLSNLELDLHARRKLIKLVGDRYDPETDIVTIVTDRCPTRKQNMDYATYLLTVLYHESWKTEKWEADKTDDDMEEYIWGNSQSEKRIVQLIHEMKEKPENLKSVASKEEILKTDEIQRYKDSVTRLYNDEESLENLEQYKQSVKKLLHV